MSTDNDTDGAMDRPGAVKHLYVHLPFCRSRCDYCDFFSLAGRMDRAPAYVEAVLEEAADYGEALDGLETIYLGGGTPTMLDGGLLGKMLRRLTGRASAGAEITAEANPVTVDSGMAQALSAAGVNRVSLGVQSFDGRLRRNLGRSGDPAAAGAAAANLRQAGMDNIGLDLIFGIPGQSIQDLQRDLERALALEPEHVSCYELTVKEGSPYQRRWRKELEETGSLGDRFYQQLVEYLEREGFYWYETSNFARPGRECRHNTACWEGKDFIGLGAGAWSTVGLDRWRNSEDLGFREGSRHSERLTLRQKTEERLILGLRQAKGVIYDDVAEIINAGEQRRLQENGFLSAEGGRISLTRRGRLVANESCARLLQEQAKPAPAPYGPPGYGRTDT